MFSVFPPPITPFASGGTKSAAAHIAATHRARTFLHARLCITDSSLDILTTILLLGDG
jgi:hypothetical protein